MHLGGNHSQLERTRTGSQLEAVGEREKASEAIQTTSRKIKGLSSPTGLRSTYDLDGEYTDPCDTVFQKLSRPFSSSSLGIDSCSFLLFVLTFRIHRSHGSTSLINLSFSFPSFAIP